MRSWAEGARQIVTSAELRGLVKKVLATRPYGVWPRKIWEGSPVLQRRVLPMLGVDAAVVYRRPPPASPFEVMFRIDPTIVVFEEAKTRLGYSGLVSRERAMTLTLEWARQARLLSSSASAQAC
jgi:hypothetical protein